MPRRAAKTDGNQAEIVEALRKAGRTVAITSRLGDGFPDIVSDSSDMSRIVPWIGGVCVMVEIKPSEGLSKGMLKAGPWHSMRRKLLTPAELKFHNSWPTIIPIVVSVEEALEVTQ
jgi:hypothetical protein